MSAAVRPPVRLLLIRSYNWLLQLAAYGVDLFLSSVYQLCLQCCSFSCYYQSGYCFCYSSCFLCMIILLPSADWVEMEDIAEKFQLVGQSTSTTEYKKKCGGDCSTCPRSRSKFSSAKSDGTYDVIVIGAGCIGSAIARELSKTNNSVLLLEAADDVTQGGTFFRPFSPFKNTFLTHILYI